MTSSEELTELVQAKDMWERLQRIGDYGFFVFLFGIVILIVVASFFLEGWNYGLAIISFATVVGVPLFLLGLVRLWKLETIDRKIRKMSCEQE